MSINAPPLPPGSAPFSASGFGISALAGRPGGQLILWTDTDKQTSFSPYCTEQMMRVETLLKHWTKWVDKLRCCAQPNPLYRKERLVPSDVDAISERLHFVVAVRDAMNCLDNMPPLNIYMQELAAVEEDIEKLHDTYLRRITLFGTKPMTKYVSEVYPAVKKMLAELMKCRDKFDSIRAKMSKSPNPQVMAKLQGARQEFAEKANQLGAMFKEMPMHQMTLAKAVDDCARSEADFCKNAMRALESVKPPDYRRRWEIK